MMRAKFTLQGYFIMLGKAPIKAKLFLHPHPVLYYVLIITGWEVAAVLYLIKRRNCYGNRWH